MLVVESFFFSRIVPNRLAIHRIVVLPMWRRLLYSPKFFYCNEDVLIVVIVWTICYISAISHPFHVPIDADL